MTNPNRLAAAHLYWSDQAHLALFTARAHFGQLPEGGEPESRDQEADADRAYVLALNALSRAEAFIVAMEATTLLRRVVDVMEDAPGCAGWSETVDAAERFLGWRV